MNEFVEHMSKLHYSKKKKEFVLHSRFQGQVVSLTESFISEALRVPREGLALDKNITWGFFGQAKMHALVQSFGPDRARNSATSELAPIYRLLHVIIVHNITPRTEGKAQIKCRDMVLMHCLRSGRPINLPLQILIAIH